ncbi:hypothetical protein ACRQ5Q_18565 [Bradyrhizobium sp. PMVTL-01]|uniref:hypothetical protein n=1 Tax=Bradyrhizobium sp. PMVTL-01 TaxID=3434999 RepID=UPI003F723CF4
MRTPLILAAAILGFAASALAQTAAPMGRQLHCCDARRAGNCSAISGCTAQRRARGEAVIGIAARDREDEVDTK